MKVTMFKVRSKVKEHSNGQMALFIKDSSLTTILKDLESIDGLMGEFIGVSGRIIRCMEEVSSNGQMEDSMKATIWKIRNRDKEYLTGLMEDST